MQSPSAPLTPPLNLDPRRHAGGSFPGTAAIALPPGGQPQAARNQTPIPRPLKHQSTSSRRAPASRFGSPEPRNPAQGPHHTSTRHQTTTRRPTTRILPCKGRWQHEVLTEGCPPLASAPPPSHAPRAPPPARAERLKTTHLRHSREDGSPTLHLVFVTNSKDVRPCVAIHRRHPSEGWDLTSSNEASETKERSQLPLG